MDLEYPPGFPSHLKPSVVALVMRVNRAHPRRNQFKRRIRQQVFGFCEIACEAAEQGEWPADWALTGISDFREWRLSSEDENFQFTSPSELERLIGQVRQEIMGSDEWLGFVERLAEAGRNRSKLALGQIPSAPKVTRKEVLLRLLEEKGITRSKWATRAGVDPSVVYDYVEGKSRPRADSKKVLAEVLGLKPSELPD